MDTARYARPDPGGGRILLLTLGAAVLLAACSHLPRHVRYSDPLGAVEHARLGASYEAQGKRKEARHQYKYAVARDPKYAAGWIALGNLEYEDKDLKAAEKCFKKALKLRPKHPGASNNLAMVYLQNGKIAEAEKLVSDSLMVSGPLKPFLLDTLANVYARQGRYDEAREALVQARRELPPGPNPLAEKLDETEQFLSKL